MAFKFKFETLMRHRKTLRDMAQKEYADAEAEAAQQLQLIEGLYAQIDQSNERAMAIREVAPLDVDQLRSIEEFIGLQNIKIEIEREKARELLSVAEEKQDILMEKAQEYKAVEILKEKELQKYKDKIKIIEMNELDDLNLMRHSRS